MVISQFTVCEVLHKMPVALHLISPPALWQESHTHKKPRPAEVALKWYSVMILTFVVRGVWPRVPTQLLPGSVALGCLLICRSLHLIIWCGNNNHGSIMRLLRIKKLQEGKTHSKCSVTAWPQSPGITRPYPLPCTRISFPWNGKV